MKMDDAKIAVRLCNEQLCDVIFPHGVEGIHRETVSVNGSGLAVHDICSNQLPEGKPSFHHPPKVAIGDDASDGIGIVEHGGTTEPLSGHLQYDFVQWTIESDRGYLILAAQV